MKCFPTVLAIQLADQAGLKELLIEPDNFLQCLSAFQRMSLVSSYEDSIRSINLWIKPENRRTSSSFGYLLSIYTLTKADILGHAIEAIIDIMEATSSNKRDKLAAATILNELYGEKNLLNEVKLSDRLSINLV